jgi:hypothetical protein
MAGLLEGVLPYLYSRGDWAKRQLGGLLSDPLGTAQQTAGGLLDSHREQQGLLAQAFANQARPFQVTDKNALGQVAERMLAGPLGFAPAGITVWHGSPHKFDRFDSSKIGTGEGAQAYGHGIYTAESPGTAAFYRDMSHPSLGNDPRDEVTALRQNWQTNTNPRHLGDDDVRYLMQDFPTLSPLRENPDVVKNIARVVNGQEPGGTVTSEAIYAMRALDKQLPPKPQGHLYKVDLPDEAVAKMLDWDAPLSKQPENVRQAIDALKQSSVMRQAERSIGQPFNKYVPRNGSEVTGQDLHGLLYEGLASRQGGEAAQAAQLLRQQGIPGIRYLDGGSRGAGQGSSNFVVFPGEENILSILERNGVPLR